MLAHHHNCVRLFLLALTGCCVHGKHILRQTTTFRENQPINRADIERGRPRTERINLSYPGTKWCGPGSTATGYDDLGEHAAVDTCCRAHDHCDHLAAGETRNNLTNNDYFTRLHCDCDREFNECLHALKNDPEANRIGQLYFTLRSKCYREDYPIYECVSYDTKLFVRRCFRYVLDDSLAKMFQWFDLPLYDGKLMVERRTATVYEGEADGVEGELVEWMGGEEWKLWG